MNKWIYPAIGDLPLSLVDNLTVKPLVEKMCAGGLKPRTVNKYVEYVKQVVKSLKGRNGEPVYKRIWDAETMDLPVDRLSKRRRSRTRLQTAAERSKRFTSCSHQRA